MEHFICGVMASAGSGSIISTLLAWLRSLNWLRAREERMGQVRGPW